MYIHNEDTICAPATVPGTGAISVIRVSGPEALGIADKVIKCKKGSISESKGYTIKFGVILDDAGTVLDEVLVSIFRAPHSYTGENSVEISCHASSYIVSSIMNLLYQAGARAAEPGEFTKRAFLNGRIDLSKAEAIIDIIHAKNEYALKSSVRQLKGSVSDAIKNLRDKIIYEIAFIESMIKPME